MSIYIILYARNYVLIFRYRLKMYTGYTGFFKNLFNRLKQRSIAPVPLSLPSPTPPPRAPPPPLPARQSLEPEGP